MLWIGIAVGVSVAFLICIVGLSAMTWSVGKGKTRGKLLEATQEELHRNLQVYWSNANAMQKGQLEVLKDIAKHLAIDKSINISGKEFTIETSEG